MLLESSQCSGPPEQLVQVNPCPAFSLQTSWLRHLSSCPSPGGASCGWKERSWRSQAARASPLALPPQSLLPLSLEI